MSIVFLFTLALLAAIVYSIYRTMRDRDVGGYELPPHHAPPSLFEESAAEDARGATGEARVAAYRDASTVDEGAARAALLARAAQGDFDALGEAADAGGGALREAALGESLKWAEKSAERLRSLAEFVAAKETLRGSVALSRAYSGAWEQSPDRAATVRALHLAALSDDAEEFSRIAETAARLVREGRLADLPADDLLALAESQFWVMSPTARASGAAFVFKQKLAALRAELPTHGNLKTETREEVRKET